jgi:hypothetical protein
LLQKLLKKVQITFSFMAGKVKPGGLYNHQNAHKMGIKHIEGRKKFQPHVA